MSKHRFDGSKSRGRVPSRGKSAKRAKHSLYALSAIAALVGGATVAAVSTVDVTPSAASIPAISPSPETVSSIGRETEPAFRAAMTDGISLTTTAQKLRALGSSALSSFLLAPSARTSGDEGNHFLPSEVMEDDANGFHPVLLASLEPSMDGDRFADTAESGSMPGLSFFDRLTLGEISVDELASLSTDETESDAVPSGSQENSRTSSKAAELAYAAPEVEVEEDNSKGAFGGFKNVFKPWGLPGPGSRIAVYDIKHAVVYMPNGRRLEAHSGLGKMKDNPRYAHVRMKGPTPPNIYKLRMRETLFHGVEAVRMLPTDDDAMRGRDGILAHTYMLRGTNGSNGCLSFKHYDKFLTAFKRGEVEKIVVVPDITHLPTYMAKLEDAPKLASASVPGQSGQPDFLDGR
ncbi:MAG: DUF2778 domain-containing protein [Salaquimonas sp.]|nr:DUF2778 domain-containing protein [Salaquimonas sp.]